MTEQTGAVATQGVEDAAVGNENAAAVTEPTAAPPDSVVERESGAPQRPRRKRYSSEELAKQVGTEADWRGVLADWQSSGLDGRSYCRQKGISEHAYYAWKRIIRLRDAERASSARRTRTPVTTASQKNAKSSGPGKQPAAKPPLFLPVHFKSPGGIEIRHACGHTLIVREGCDAAMLRLVLDAIERR